MPKLNILIIGDANAKSLPMVFNSKYLNKLYTNFEYQGAIDIKFNTFQELAVKCKSLKIDLVLVENEKYILQGIADVLRINYVNCIALNSFWTQLILSNSFAQNLLQKYDINIPKKVMYPDKFPVVFRADRFSCFANSLDDVIRLRQEVFKFSAEISKSVFLEEYIDGEEFVLTSIFDGKHLITFPVKGLDKEYIADYNAKLQNMFINENPNFIGYINSDVILDDGKLYNLGFSLDFPKIEQDLIFVLISAIYQKLNEINI